MAARAHVLFALVPAAAPGRDPEPDGAARGAALERDQAVGRGGEPAEAAGHRALRGACWAGLSGQRLGVRGSSSQAAADGASCLRSRHPPSLPLLPKCRPTAPSRPWRTPRPRARSCAPRWLPSRCVACERWRSTGALLSSFVTAHACLLPPFPPQAQSGEARKAFTAAERQVEELRAAGDELRATLNATAAQARTHRAQAEGR